MAPPEVVKGSEEEGSASPLRLSVTMVALPAGPFWLCDLE